MSATPFQSGSIVVTGGGGSLGRRIARLCVARGHRVVTAGRSGVEVRSVSSESRLPQRSLDVRDAEAVARLARWVHLEVGPLVGWVNAAALQGPIGRLEDASAAEWAATVTTNLVGTYHGCRAAVAVMRDQGSGSVVNVSGGGATSSRPAFSAYACSKTAVARLSEVLADELAGTGVRVNAVAPGRFVSAMTRQVIAAGSAAGAREVEQASEMMHRQGDGARADTLAEELVYWLLSPRSAPLSGRLVSALHDPWRSWDGEELVDIMNSERFTLRRVP
jgi:NAD(P)-dependent dehydrogenase (short-subunit alcohol dehydrogenase family)